MTVLERISGLDQFFVQQKFRLIANDYRVSTLGPDNKADEPLVHVHQKRMKIREQVNLFADEALTQPLLRLQARKVFEFRGRTDVLLPDGTVIGQLQKVFGKSLFRSTWEILDTNGTVVAKGHESSLVLALLRRIWGALPYVGDVPFFIPFNFDIFIGDKVVGTYKRPIGITDRYVMDLTGDSERRIDRRVAVAFAIALDALQDR